MSEELKDVTLSRDMLEGLTTTELAQLTRKFKSHIEATQYSKGDIYLDNSHEGQRDFHKAANRVRMFFGGNRSGKTTAGVNEVRWLSEGNHPYRKVRCPSKGCVVLQDFQTHANDIIHPKILEWFPPKLIVGMDKNQTGTIIKYYIRNGGIIDVKSHDQELKVFEGSDYDWVWFDEPCPRAIFTAIWRGLTDRRGIAFMTGTPIVEPWMYDLYKKAEKDQNKGMYWAKFIDIEDNAINLGEGNREEGLKRIEEFLDGIDPDERDARKSGKFLHMGGVIFKQFDHSVHMIPEFPWPTHWPVYLSVDPHPRKPWAFSFLGVTPTNNKILLRSGLIPGVVADVARELIWNKSEIKVDRANASINVFQSWIDNYANVESMIVGGGSMNSKGQLIIDELNHAVMPTLPGFRAAPKNVEDKITFFKGWLKPSKSQYGERPTFFAFDIPENDTFINEIEHYAWAKHRGANRNKFKNQPVKENDDVLDTIMQMCLVLGSKKSDATREQPKKPHNYLRSRREH